MALFALFVDQIIIEQGDHGLFYGTNTVYPGVFVVANDKELCRQRAGVALAILDGNIASLDDHIVYNHEPSGKLITIPCPEPLTPEQRQEAIDRLQIQLEKLTPY